MKIDIIRPSDRESWLDLRQKDVTASVAAGLLNAHPYVTQYQLWAEKTGQAEVDTEETEAMERGNLLEPVAIELARKRHPDWNITYKNDRAYYRAPELRIGATPDAFLEMPGREGLGNFQIKTASESAFREFWMDPDTKEIIPPSWIAVQAIVEAKLTGCAWACVGVLVVTWRGTLKLRVVDIPLHERLWSRLQEATAEFWRVAESGEHPPVDWERDGSTVMNVYRDSMPDRKDLTSDEDLDVIISRFRDARDRESEAAREASILRPQIIYALGNSEAGFTRRWEFSGRTQYRAAHHVASSETRVLRVKQRRDIDDRF